MSLPFETDEQHKAYLVNLRLNGYRDVPHDVIEALLRHEHFDCVKAAAHAAVSNPSGKLTRMLSEVYWLRRKAERDTRTPDDALHLLVSALMALKEEKPTIFLDAANDTTSTPMLAITGLVALAEIKHPQAEAIGLKQLNDPREGVRANAASVLPRVSSKSYDALKVMLEKPALDTPTAGKVVSGVLKSRRDDAVEVVYQWLRKKDRDTVARCCGNLSIERPPGAAEVMIRLYDKSNDAGLRQTLLDMMYCLGDSDAMGKLISTVEGGSAEEARRVVDHTAGYEKVPGWNDRLRAAARKRGDESLLPLIAERQRAAQDRDDR